jgi:hypothetical protein
MRAPIPISSARLAACVAATGTLLVLSTAPSACASAGQSLFATPTTTATGAAKPPTGAANVKTTPALKVKTTAAPAAATPKTTTTTATTATTETSSTTSTPMIMAVVAMFIVLGGVAFYILRDARSVAPVVEGGMTGGTRNPEGRLRRRRAQAKAARRQRKRHRKAR